jgi:transcriptional regulator with XRE-family HTH domain
MRTIYTKDMETSNVFHVGGENFLRVETIGDRILAFATALNDGKEWGAQTSLAERLGMSTQQLSSYIKGGTMPSPEILKRFRDVGASVEWLLFGEGEMRAPKKAIELDGGDIAIIHGDMTLSELADWYLSQQKEKPKKKSHDHDDEGEEEGAA